MLALYSYVQFGTSLLHIPEHCPPEQFGTSLLHIRYHDGMHANTVKTVCVWALVAAWCAFIFFASAHTGADLDAGDDLLSRIRLTLDAWQTAAFGPDADVISTAAHFLEFLVLGVLLFLALSRHFERPRTALAVAIVLASMYGATDEFHQLFVDGRVCDPLDWLTDTLGAALGAALTWHKAHRS